MTDVFSNQCQDELREAWIAGINTARVDTLPEVVAAQKTKRKRTCAFTYKAEAIWPKIEARFLARKEMTTNDVATFLQFSTEYTVALLKHFKSIGRLQNERYGNCMFWSLAEQGQPEAVS